MMVNEPPSCNQTLWAILQPFLTLGVATQDGSDNESETTLVQKCGKQTGHKSSEGYPLVAWKLNITIFDR